MPRALLALLFALFMATATGAVEPPMEGTLLVAARNALPQGTSANELSKVLKAGLWNTNRTAVAVSLARPEGSIVLVFLRQTKGTYLAVNASGVEGGNFGKLGRDRADYERFETTPVEWQPRNDGLFQVVMRTRAWRAGRRYTVSEALVIKPDGTILWRYYPGRRPPTQKRLRNEIHEDDRTTGLGDVLVPLVSNGLSGAGHSKERNASGSGETNFAKRTAQITCGQLGGHLPHLA